jgi:hypothetical protein
MVMAIDFKLFLKRSTIRTITWSLRNRLLSFAFVGFLIFLFLLFLVPSSTFYQTVALFLLILYLSGTSLYVYEALRKITGAKDKPEQFRLVMAKIEQLKKDLNLLSPIIGTISASGLATMVLSASQIALPRSLIIGAGIGIEIMVTITFALLYWWFFFFLIDRFNIKNASILAGLLNLIPILIGAYATVTIAIYFNLDILQDFAAAFLPFLIVYYMINKLIPDYLIPPIASLEKELTKTTSEIDEVKREVYYEIIEGRKSFLDTKLSELKIKKEKLTAAREFSQISFQAISKIQKDFDDFSEQVTVARKKYLNKTKKLSRTMRQIAIDDKLVILKKTHNSVFYLTSEEPLSDDICHSLVEIISLQEVSSKRTKFPIFKFRPKIDFEQLYWSISSIAITESIEQDIPLLCQEFDRKTLKEYLPAKALFEANIAKYKISLNEIKKYPSSFIGIAFVETTLNLLSSIDEFKNRIEDRIANYLSLEKEQPDCYVVKGFRSFFGIFGIGSLKDILKELDQIKLRISNRQIKIDQLKESIRILDARAVVDVKS